MRSSLFIVLCAMFLLAGCGNGEKQCSTQSGVNPEAFSSIVNGDSTALYVLTNKSGMEVCVTNYGGRIVSIMVPDKDGNMRDVVLGFDSIDSYVNVEGNNFGALIGRYGNRIEQGKFSIDGKNFQLPQNNFGHSLHGGPEGFYTQMWKATKLDDQTLELTHRSPDGFAGYPGNLDVKVIYRLTDDNAIDITYEAVTDAPTIVNLTNHSYFNFGDHDKNILDHEVMIDADSITPIDSTFMTHGTMMAVNGTPFDFRKSKAVGRDIDADDEQLHNGKGYDHNYVLNTKGDISKVSASIYNPSTGIMMEVFTTEPGLQFYVGNFLDGTVKGKRGVAYPYRGAICMETQHYPNSPNHSTYPSTVLRPGEVYRSHCIYRFGIKR